MGINVGTQAIVFLLSVILGVTLCLVNEVIGLLRINAVFTFALDFMFCMVYFVSIILFSMYYLDGQVRFYTLAGSFIGYFVSKITVSKPFSALLRVIFTPVRLICKFFVLFFKNIFIFLKKECIILLNIISKRKEKQKVGKSKVKKI